MTNNCNKMVRDPVYMTIPHLTEDIGVEKISKIVSSLNLGSIESVDKVQVQGALRQRLADTYTIYFNKWTPTGDGAEIRQKLQNGEEVELVGSDGVPLWTVHCRSCMERASREAQKRKPIKPAYPYDVIKTQVTLPVAFPSPAWAAATESPSPAKQLHGSMGVGELCEFLDAHCAPNA